MDKSLKITGKNQKFLTKNQQKFNQLTQKIEKLEKEIISDSEKLNKLLEYHAKEVRPAFEKTAEARLNFAKALDKVTCQLKFSKKQLELIGGIIIEHCDAAFRYVEPDVVGQLLFNRWSEISYEEEANRQKEEMKEEMEDFLKQNFGMDIDLEDIDSSPEGQAAFAERMKEQFRKRDLENEEFEKNRKKSKKQIIQEEREKAQEEVKTKNLRSIFYSLAKVLHPDLEQNPVARAEKEEVMKKITVAYEEQDLATLLKLEMEWVHKETEHLELISDAKLKIYIDALKEQEKELLQEKYAIANHPRFAEIARYKHLSEVFAKRELAREVKQEKDFQRDLKHNVRVILDCKDKKSIMSLVDGYYETKDQESLEVLRGIFGF